MGSSHYQPFDLTKQKRDWIAFYSSTLIVSEVLIIYNIIVLFFFEGFFISPIVMTLLLILKKLWILAFDHRYYDNENEDEQYQANNFLGLTPAVITDRYVRARQFEFLIHCLNCLTQISHVIVYNNDSFIFLTPFILGVFSTFGYLQQDKYFHCNKNWWILLQSIECTIGAILTYVLLLKCLKLGIIFIIIYILSFIVIYRFLESKNIIPDIILEQVLTLVFGYIEVGLRCFKGVRIYKKKLSAQDSLLPFMGLTQIIILFIIDRIFSNNVIFYNLNIVIMIFLVMYIPSIIQISQEFYKYMTYKTDEKHIVIMKSDTDNLIEQQMIEKFFTFNQHNFQIFYEIYDINYELLQPLMTKIFSDQQRLYNMRFISNGVEQKISMTIDKEILSIKIMSHNLEFIDMILSSFSDSEFYKYDAQICFENESNAFLYQNMLTKALFLKHYKLAYSNIFYLQNNQYWHPYQNNYEYKQLHFHIVAFNKQIFNILKTNPNQVLYDLYDKWY